VDEAKRLSYSDESERIRAIEKLKEDLETKRTTKRQVRGQRKGNDSGVPPTSIESIPIEFRDESEFVHYPVSPEDIRDLLARMPAGIADGLQKITFCLGAERREDPEEPWLSKPTPDPWVGRYGYELIPGVYQGHCLGTYDPGRKEINLHAYVYDPKLIDHSIWGCYLRLHLLMTFVHEIGHHYDFTFRIGRGRWRGDRSENVEIYAEKMQYQWLNEYVIPYLQDKYASEVQDLNAWMEDRIGIAVPLDLLAGDPRSTAKNGMIRTNSLFDTADAFQTFVTNLSKGKNLREARYDYANDLHMGEKYDIALQILDLLLTQNPNDVPCITLKADIYEHLNQFDRALGYAEQALTLQNDFIKAYRVLSDAYEGMKLWDHVLAVTDKLLILLGQDDISDRIHALSDRANAYIEMGNAEEAMTIIRQLDEGHKAGHRYAKRLREKMKTKGSPS
jgi:hypothetical protein